MTDVEADAADRSANHLFVGARPKISLPSILSRGGKRASDLVIASLALVVLLPVIAMVILTLLVLQGRPIFIAHHRVGRYGRMFPCFKFRTMVNNNDQVLANYLLTNPAERMEWEATRKLRNDPRVTPFGAVMRKSSLDEVPQLVNIVLGHMSLVGPRPIVPAEAEHYGPYFADYKKVRPGLTGLWQISGRSDTAYNERVQLDVAYVAGRSLAGDLVIMAKTLPAVLKARGSY
ncbi:sugar transferase [Neorhizobium sp. JUb45]|uniref:sugar transferase n=1 Tax=unclassified Neorhizobium TaxID=2629175 RepID=UPI001051BD0B|nr:sugar transferase [Neorhizobium sp. JUb45]TCQ99968.1 exopolysaccharide production protein ExoY [Neorhizobium sp. JUb45]